MREPVILFYDLVCPEAYDPSTAKAKALGGTEATIIRIAEELSKSYTVYVAQHNRHEITKFGAHYVPVDARPLTVTHAVSIRHLGCLPWLREQYRNAKLYAWLHDIVGKEFAKQCHKIEEAKAELITVSEWHKSQVREALSLFNSKAYIQYIYNPIAAYAEKRDSTPVNRDKLLFFSSPHKGLVRTLELFETVRQSIPSIELHIANPGYLELQKGSLDRPGVKVLDCLPHEAMIKELRSALVVFHMNSVFPETFGLVYAEANAVGVPFLMHKGMGALHEISEHPSQFIDTHDTELVVKRIIEWRNGARPIVCGKPQFKLDRVIQSWHNLIRKQY